MMIQPSGVTARFNLSLPILVVNRLLLLNSELTPLYRENTTYIFIIHNR